VIFLKKDRQTAQLAVIFMGLVTLAFPDRSKIFWVAMMAVMRAIYALRILPLFIVVLLAGLVYGAAVPVSFDARGSDIKKTPFTGLFCRHGLEAGVSFPIVR
jgi:hypothetical protein